jgi:hypothetical protein
MSTKKFGKNEFYLGGTTAILLWHALFISAKASTCIARVYSTG